jgi:hypothetical protein
MLNTLFQGVFDTTEYSIEIPNFLLCIAVALVIGIFFAIIYSKNRCSRSFVVTLALLPAVVSVIIMMVNGNVGAGVAVAGAFSLVRFRSVPGSAREIGTLFLAMASGLICGMGYLGYAVLFSVVMGAAMLLLNQFSFGGNSGSFTEKVLRITIPEDLNYNEIFDDIFTQYTSHHEVLSVKTTNMGSLFRLQYQITLRDDSKEKEFIDALRCRNGNLEIAIARQEAAQYEL